MDGGILFIVIIVRLAFGIGSAAIANAKGRSVVGWFFGGFFLDLIGLIIILCMPNLKEQKRKEEALRMQNLRMQERLRQEQLKNEAFRQHAAMRLDAHDNALQMDTHQTQPSPLLADSSSYNPQRLQSGDAGQDNLSMLQQQAHGSYVQPPKIAWHYANGPQSVGPVPEDEMVRMFLSGELTGQTLVWRAGLDGWIKANTVPAFATVTV